MWLYLVHLALETHTFGILTPSRHRAVVPAIARSKLGAASGTFRMHPPCSWYDSVVLCLLFSFRQAFRYECGESS